MIGNAIRSRERMGSGLCQPIRSLCSICSVCERYGHHLSIGYIESLIHAYCMNGTSISSMKMVQLLHVQRLGA